MSNSRLIHILLLIFLCAYLYSCKSDSSKPVTQEASIPEPPVPTSVPAVAETAPEQAPVILQPVTVEEPLEQDPEDIPAVLNKDNVVTGGPDSGTGVTEPPAPAVEKQVKAVAAAPPPAPVVRVRPDTAVEDQNSLYDRNSDAYALLQKANEALAGFPVNAIGEVDWMRALDDGLIDPRANLQGHGELKMLDSEIVMTNTRQMSPVVFPHRAHTRWLACDNCHESIFAAKKAANKITMDDIFRGKYCGVCHDKVAFSTYLCDKCHVAQ